MADTVSQPSFSTALKEAIRDDNAAERRSFVAPIADAGYGQTGRSWSQQSTSWRSPAALDLPDVVFLGKMGSGKTTASSYLLNYGYDRFSFATSVRNVARMLWGEEGTRDREKLIGIGMSMRELDPDVWANLMAAGLDCLSGGTPRTIDDCRFPNEFAQLTQRGFVTVRVMADLETRKARLIESGKYQNDDQFNDPSECALDDFEAQYTIVNDAGDKADFYGEIVRIIERERKSR